MMTACVFPLMARSSASKSIWKCAVSGSTTTSLPPAVVAKHAYSGKYGAMATNSVFSLTVSARSTEVSAAAAPQEM